MAIDISNVAQQSISATAFERSVLDQLREAVGFDAAFFLVKGQETTATTVGFDADTATRLVVRGETYGQELSRVMKVALSGRGVAVDTEVCGVQHVRKMRYYREIAATIRGQHSLLAYVPWRGRALATMMLGRAGSSFSHNDIALVESLLPSLGVARAAFGCPAWTPSPLAAVPSLGLAERLHLRSSSPLASVSTAWGTIFVRDRAGYREMVARTGSSELIWTRATLKDPSRSGWPYSELLHLAPVLAGRRSRALFVGCGGGVSLQQFANAYPGMTLDLVEHEAAVVKLAQDWFGLNTIPKLTVHIADGVDFIANAPPQTWDVIVLDAYDAEVGAPGYCQHAFLPKLRRALCPGGAVACNLIGTLGKSGPVRDFISSCRTVFDTVRIVPVIDNHEVYARDTVRNVVVIAR